MNVEQLINLLQQVSNKDSEVIMWAWGEDVNEYFEIESINIERGMGDVVLSPHESHKVNDFTLTISDFKP